MKMRKSVLCFVFLAALTGCATTGGRVQPEDAVTRAVRDRVDDFLTLAMTGRYDEMVSMVVSGKAAGFNGRAFVEDRFRAPADRFEIVAWDRMLVKVIPLKDGPGMLSSAPVTVRLPATNEVKPLFVNLHWIMEGGEWKIDAYAEK